MVHNNQKTVDFRYTIIAHTLVHNPQSIGTVNKCTLCVHYFLKFISKEYFFIFYFIKKKVVFNIGYSLFYCFAARSACRHHLYQVKGMCAVSCAVNFLSAQIWLCQVDSELSLNQSVNFEWPKNSAQLAAQVSWQ